MNKNVQIAIDGVGITILAVALTLIMEAVSYFTPNSNINPNLIGIIYLIFGGILLWKFYKIKNRNLK